MKTQSSTHERRWLVGASQGIGLELIRLWLEEGHRVIASARSATQSLPLQELQFRYPKHLTLLDLDVTNPLDCEIKSQQAWSIYNGLDCWFYNVGAYQPMRIAQWEWSQFVSMNQANYLGAVSLMLPLHPKFKQQGHGRWIWNGSLAAYFGLPYGGGYSAPKAALVNLAESLQPELQQDGIRLQIINHGFVRTRLTAKNQFSMPGLLEPQQAAQKINLGMHRQHGFEIRFPFGLRLVLSLFKLLPYRWSLSLTRRMLN
jgi:short-subunit dehydrogenase